MKTIILAITFMGLITYAVRLIPFHGLKLIQELKVIDYLSSMLPIAILTVLVVFSFHLEPHPISLDTLFKLICLTLVVLMQIKWRSATLSMIVGLSIYILLSTVV